MLNNLTNFFNLIRGRKIKTTLADSDLIPIGVRDPRFDGNYQPSAIKFEDLQAQVGGLQTVAVDGVTITGDGTPSSPLTSIGGGDITYSNVFFVDPVNGNDGTGQVNRFDKPYANVATAITAAGITSPTATTRALVYVRRGTYTGWTVNLQNYVDIHCETGVVFDGFWSWSDGGGSGKICNITGDAVYENSSYYIIQFTGASTINFSFNYINSTSGLPIYIQPFTGTSNITITGNSIYATTLGVGGAIFINQDANVTFNIRKWINASHSIFDIRNSYSGQLTINTPKIILNATNYYGGNFKQAIIVYSATSAAKIIVNADLVNEMPGFVGGIAGMITFWSAPQCYLEFNGKIYAGNTYGVFASSSNPNARLVINGSIESAIQPVFVSSYTNCYIRNGVIVKTSTVAGAPVALNQYAKLFMNNCFIYNAQVDGTCLLIIDNTNDVNLYNVTGQTEGVSGYGITGSVALNARIHNSRFNKPIDPNVTDLLAPTGYISDANVIVPKY